MSDKKLSGLNQAHSDINLIALGAHGIDISPCKSKASTNSIWSPRPQFGSGLHFSKPALINCVFEIYGAVTKHLAPPEFTVNCTSPVGRREAKSRGVS